MKVEHNVSLAPLTTLGVGGPARHLIEAFREEDVIEAVRLAKRSDLPALILGEGSNIVVGDRGYDGYVIRVMTSGISEIGSDAETVSLTAAAGESWDRFVSLAVDRGLAGIECLSGIPGTVGATPIQNVGAYGQEVSQTIERVKCFDTELDHVVEIDAADCGFSYRQSIFNSSRHGRFIVLSVTFRLMRNGRPVIAYKELAERFGGKSPGLAEVRDAVISIRAAKSMVIDKEDPNSRSVGSFFKNPVINEAEFDRIRSMRPDVPSFAAPDGIKIPAAWLIENSGLHKGFAMGRAGISSNHTLALINRGGASTAEILALRDHIREKVAETFDIELRQEPVMVGDQA
ncbi:MAG: UDP-N-acetylmuramate dehydrogenase [Acidobacteria bacterium]|nr:UDP-N-acetylmuramate dehydrogenase [Acidobacteriota bacterium]MCW5948887.1 UDP-N-acetylmuramate dehydrogenase [Pyrinomonadaceae bacterium]